MSLFEKNISNNSLSFFLRQEIFLGFSFCRQRGPHIFKCKKIWSKRNEKSYQVAKTCAGRLNSWAQALR